MNVRINESWRAVLQPEFDKPYFEILTSYVRHAYASSVCYPPAKLIFHAFDACPFDKVRVVILGQDPYHEPGQAEGWAFSVPEGVRIPPSLENIYKELQRDLGKPVPTSGHLESWVNQGVLLLNATLTVEAHHAGSHQGKGWEELTDAAIMALNEKREHLVFMLCMKHYVALCAVLPLIQFCSDVLRFCSFCRWYSLEVRCFTNPW